MVVPPKTPQNESFLVGKAMGLLGTTILGTPPYFLNVFVSFGKMPISFRILGSYQKVFWDS